MKRDFYIIILFLFIPIATLFAQNLCTNGDFDTYTTPPNDYSQVCRATGWLSPSGICSLVPGTGSPDYYNTAGSGGAKPPATWWATVSPHSGGGMEGFVTVYPGSSPNYREYIMRQLSAPLVVGLTYSISMWITNGISSLHQLGANNLGVAFSMSPLVQSVGTPIAYTPQCEMSTVLYSTVWKLVTFTYTATANYQYVTIGNFRNDAATTTQSFGSSYGCYYYIDDVIIQLSTQLPVEWLNFTCRSVEGKNILEWSTASEINSDYFKVERSDDGINFKEAGKIKAAGSSNQVNQYIFTDDHISDAYYYRINETDFNGEQNFSKIIFVPFNNAGTDLHIFLENRSSLVIEGFFPDEHLFTMQLYSINGQLALMKEQNVSNYFSEKYNVSALNKGIYFLKGYYGKEPFSKKIVIP
jgi:hypothetical protein